MKKKTVSFPIVIDEAKNKVIDVEPHSVFGLFCIHGEIRKDGSLSRSHWNVTHIPSRRFIIAGLPWISVAGRIAKHMNQLMMQGIIAREAKSEEAEVALCAFPGGFVSYLHEARTESYRASNCEDCLAKLEELFARYFSSATEGSVSQEQLELN